MSKVKVKTLIGSVVTVAFFLTVIVAFLFYAFPENVASATGFGPYDGQRILTFCAIMVAAMFLLGWLTEKAFDFAGKSGLYFQWGQKKAESITPVTNTIPSEEDEDEPVFSEDVVSEHLRFRYGRRWKRKVRLLLVMGNQDDVHKAAPGLCHDLWQEGDGNVLIYGGDAQSLPDEIFLAKLKRLRSNRPVDGIIQVMNISTLPTDSERDAFLRCRQKADHLLGWQAPVWLWQTDKATGAQPDAETTPAGVIFGPGGTVKGAREAFSTLAQRLQKAGMAQILNNPAHDGLLQLSSRLRHELKASLTVLLSGLMQGSAAWRLRGVMFSPELAVAGTMPNTRIDTPTWKAVIDDCDAVSGRKLGFNWLKVLRLLLLSLILLWGAGTLLSLIVNRAQIYQAQETARQAADTAKPLAERLHNQLVLQQSIARLQHREATGAPWYTRFGLNQDSDTLAALWPLYAKNNAQLMRDATADYLRQQLNAFVQLPPASDARTQGTQHTYDVLKSYLMLARPDKSDASWLAKYVLVAWPKRQNVPDGTWQDLAPKLLGFYAQNLPAHPEWKIKPDAELISTVRQILLKQIGQRNAESGLYQDMLKRVASNWPDLTLADMTGDTDASTVFSTDEVVPGMFTRQAWEEQVQDAINEVVKTRRDEIDWVLTDKTHQTGSDISPEALKSRLTERYFTDFGNAWLNMVNSIQWQEATSLSEAIAQLNLIGDVRQSPLVALMNTLAWQGKTGQKGEALADSIVDSAKKLIGQKKNARQFIEQARGPKGPLDGVFGPLMGLMEGKEGTGANGNLSFQSWLARVTQVRLKLQQVTSAPDPQAMSQMLAQTVFQGKAIDLTDTRDYESAVANWPEAEKPSLAGLCTALENRLARSGGMEALVPQNSSAQEQGRESGHSNSPQLSAVKSGRDLLDQARLLSRWLSEQPQGWLASHRLIKTVRWDTVDQIPPLDSSGRSRLVPPKAEYRAQLKRLYLQKNWTELVEQASQMFCEGVNHFWLDLQWYLWQGLSHAGQPWENWADSVLLDLRLLLKRLPGLEGLAWNDGTPFADEVTTAWIAEKVNEEGLLYGDEPAAVVNSQADDVLLLESEAMEKGDAEGPEAALAWLQSRPGMDTPRHRWLTRLLMARVAEQYGRNEMALHLLGELTSSAPQLTLEDWEPALLFEVQARRLKLLRLKAGRSESDKARLMPEMDTLLAGLIAIDPARAMVLCG